MSIIKEKMLIKVSAQDNNNKFYHVILEDNGILTKRWGRVGTEGTSQRENGSEGSFNSIVRSKTNRGYKDTGIISTSKESTDRGELEKVAKNVLSKQKGNSDIDRLIEILVKVNAHQILETSGGMIKVDTNGVIGTPLGILNKEAIKDAEKILKKIKDPAKVPASTVETYLSLVPQKVPHGRGWADNFFNEYTSLVKQKEFLEQLRESLEWYESEAKAQDEATSNNGEEIDYDVKYANLFRSKIDILDPNSKKWKEINKYYLSSRKSVHRSARLQLKRVYVLTDEQGTETYKKVKKNLGNEKLLWHGTRAVNVLSILRSGLYVPPTHGGTIQTNGRMFGDGVYFSDTSTKSLNYADGYWSHTKENNVFMFLADVTLGQEYRPRWGFSNKELRESRNGKSRFGKPYNSIYVAPGTCGVVNNEIIVWDTSQINLRYLCEFG